MVQVAIAGAVSELGREVLDKLTERHHDVLVLGRGDTRHYPSMPRVQWKQTSYEDKAELVELLRGVNTLLCFWDVSKDPDATAQKRLVDAAIEAGVKRYAPSEWSMGKGLEECISVFPWYAGKIEMRKHLAAINADKKVIEYTLFQPGIFMEYLGYPKKIAKHMTVIHTVAGLEEGRIIGVQGHFDDPVTFTSVQDIAQVVARAIEYDGEWPVSGGITGERLSLNQVKRIGEEIQGKPFRVDALKEEDVLNGDVKLDDIPAIGHPAIPKDKLEEVTPILLRGLLVSLLHGGWTVTDEWNRLLPEFKCTSVRSFADKLKQTR